MPKATDNQPMFDWPRFWIPLGGSIDLSDSGFLSDPTRARDPDAPRTIAALAGWRSLALLGEPGIGKSMTLKEEADSIERTAQEGVLQSSYFDLRSFSSEVLLLQRVFENEKMVRWKQDGSHLVLHLDSLDEALLRIETIANLIAAELPNLPVDRLSIRIACRTAVWPADTLGVALEGIWPKQAGTFELAPLRREDIFTALDAHGIPAEGFLRALFSAHAVPFAIKPLTLRMLLAIYRQYGALPESSIELYKRGCLALCDESNKSRRDTGRRGRLNAAQRMRLSGRIAAATILGNRFAIWIGIESECPDEDIPVSALAGSEETGDFAPFTSSDDDVRETLDTGLFGSHGEQQMGWAHRGYGEFLTALYLHARGVPAATILKAVRHPSGGLIPQLSNVAAWAASLDDTVRAALIAEDPVALLAGDLSGLEDDAKRAILKSLLDAVQKRRVTDSVYKHSEIYRKLGHAVLADDLRPVVLDKKLEVNTRRLALLIAERCGVTDLRSELLQLAFDAAEHPQVRSGAIAALRPCCDADVAQRILPLAQGAADAEDSNHEIKGDALRLLWPDHISAAQLFPLLTPSADHFFGAYAHFLRTLPETLKTQDFLPALQWATGTVARGDRSGNGHARSLADEIMFKVWPIFDTKDLTEAFVDHVAARLRDHGPLFLGLDRKAQIAFVLSLRSDAARRRKFLGALCTRSLLPIDAFIFKRAEFIHAADLEWLLSIAPGGAEEAQGIDGETLFNLVDCAFDDENVGHVEALHAAVMRSSMLRARYGRRFDAVPLDSPMAEDWRNRKAQLRALEDSLPSPIESDPAGKVRLLLAEAESGRWQAWWQMTVFLALTPKSRGYGDELDYLIVTTPSWKEADQDIRDRIVAGAAQYLASAEISVDEWLGRWPMPICREAVAGLRALLLLKQLSPEGYARLETDIWRKWAPVIVGLPRGNEAKGSSELNTVLLDALDHAPEEFVSAVRTIIRLEREEVRKSGNESGRSFFTIVNNLFGCWNNDPLRDAISAELRDPDNTPAEYAVLLDALLEAGVESALEYALELLDEVNASTHERDIAIVDVLLRRAPARSWPTIQAAMGADDELARKLVARVASHFEFGTPFYRDFNELDIAALYRLVTRLYPPADESERRTGLMGTWDSIAYLRDGLPRHLSGLGTETAVMLLNRLIAEYPQLTQLAYDLTLAERAMRLTTWSPPSPKEVLAIADTPSLKLVNSAADLSDILIDALGKFAGSLHGAQTPVRDLWDRQGGKKEVYRPIDENGFTDVITRFLRSELERKGIFANREVEVGRVPGAPVGRRTDILVNAVRRQPDGETYDTVSAVIETKGCWNDQLFTALEAQLFRDYMVRLRAQAGVYLVAWFETDMWDTTDYRRRDVPKMTLDAVKAELEKEAAQLPDGIMVRTVVIECRAPS
jgi:hypothetical protein